MSYIITTICIGSKYELIRPHWVNRINNKCKHKEMYILDNTNIKK